MGIKTIVLGQRSVRILFSLASATPKECSSAFPERRVCKRALAALCRSSAACLAGTSPTHARPVQMQTFLRWFPPKKGSTNIACERKEEEISFIYSILVYTLSTSKKARKRERNENNFYLSFVIVCKIIYTRRKFLFHPKLPFSSSVWLSVLLRFPNLKNSPCLLHRKTNFLKNIYSAQASIHTLYICVIVVLFRQYIRRFFSLSEGEREKGRES